MRCEGWEDKLAQYIEQSQTIAFEWGKNDCALWASTFVDSILGTDYAGQWSGQYSTEIEATELMLARGFDSPAAIPDAHLQSIPVKAAGRGDIVALPSGAIGICCGRKSYFLKPDSGLVHVLTINCTKAWKV